jgi:hypothetical protein
MYYLVIMLSQLILYLLYVLLRYSKKSFERLQLLFKKLLHPFTCNKRM